MVERIAAHQPPHSERNQPVAEGKGEVVDHLWENAVTAGS
jgi:hypothetical protein